MLKYPAQVVGKRKNKIINPKKVERKNNKEKALIQRTNIQ